MLGHHLSRNLPHFRFEPRPVIPEEWDEVARKIYVQVCDYPFSFKAALASLNSEFWENSGTDIPIASTTGQTVQPATAQSKFQETLCNKLYGDEAESS